MSIKAYKKVIKELANNVDYIPLYPINAQDEYSLGPEYNIIDDNVAFPFDMSVDMFFVEKIEVNLGMWFELKKRLIIWHLVKNQFD